MEDAAGEGPVLAHIQKLVAVEHRLFDKGSLHDDESRQLAAIEVQLDQCWDLLRQRRALRETGGDVEEARFGPRTSSSDTLDKLSLRGAALPINYLEDFSAGQRFGSGTLRVDVARVKAFAAEFDPQPFHLDEASASRTLFRGLAASGWYTAAMTMRLLVEGELRPAGGIIGAGFDELRWPLPVRPGDVLRVESEVLDVRPSKSRPEQGVIKIRTTTLNQNDEAVQVFVGNLIVLRRAAH